MKNHEQSQAMIGKNEAFKLISANEDRGNILAIANKLFCHIYFYQPNEMAFWKRGLVRWRMITLFLAQARLSLQKHHMQYTAQKSKLIYAYFYEKL